MPTIKEIALKVADSLRNKIDGISHMQSNQGLVAFAEAFIESYKAELLKGIEEPVAEFKRHPFGDYTELSFSACYSARRGDKLYTSDQVAAAILKATKLLEEKLSWLDYTEKMNKALVVEIGELRAKISAAQEQIERPPAIDAYETYMADGKESDPVERLRFFLSLALKGKDWLDVERFIKDVSDQLAKAEQRVAEYNELIYAVQTKHHDETRHQTALRYIRNAENRPSNTAANTESS